MDFHLSLEAVSTRIQTHVDSINNLEHLLAHLETQMQLLEKKSSVAPAAENAVVIPEDVKPEDLNRYQDYQSLNVAIQSGERAPIALIYMTHLLELHHKGGRIQCRQEQPKEAIFEGTIGDDVLLLALSYCWCEKGNPDPQGKVLGDICCFAEYLEESRYFGTTKKQGRTGGCNQLCCRCTPPPHPPIDAIVM